MVHVCLMDIHKTKLCNLQRGTRCNDTNIIQTVLYNIGEELVKGKVRFI